jgi:hypothetical protein
MLALCGSMAGAYAGIIFSNVILSLVRTVWIDIVGTSDLALKINISTLATSALTGFIISVATMVTVTAFNSMKKRGIRHKTEDNKMTLPSKINLFQKTFLIIVASILVCFLILSFFIKMSLSTTFFITGVLSLALCTIAFNLPLTKQKKQVNKIGIVSLGIANLRINKRKNILLVSVLGISIFLLVSIGINQKISFDISGNENGTGGFKYLLRMTMPVGLLEADKLVTARDATEMVKIRLKSGDDISCLNLNRTSDYSLCGIDPETFIRRGSFKFAGSINRQGIKNKWELLNSAPGDDEIPAIADQTVITWSLGKKLGDVLEITNEKGERKKLKLVASLDNSIFQGNIIISEENLKTNFPSVSGYDMFLTDTDDENMIDAYGNKFRGNGVEVLKTADLLARFYSVESTYISIFFVLGIFSFILGSVGVSILIFKNMIARKKEFAVLNVLGFGGMKIFAVIFFEYGVLYLAGIIAGLLSSTLALLSQFLGGSSEFSGASILIIIAGIALAGFMWITISILLSVPKNPIKSLRNQ